MICLIQNTNLNGYKINISNNTFQAKNQTQIFNLINIINNTDINEQYVYLNQNNYGIFKKIGFYNNSTVYNVIINEKENNVCYYFRINILKIIINPRYTLYF